MRVHKDGYLQARSMTVWLPDECVRRAMKTYPFLTQGLEAEVEAYLGMEVEGAVRFRLTGRKEGMRQVQIDSDWVQPTRA